MSAGGLTWAVVGDLTNNSLGLGNRVAVNKRISLDAHIYNSKPSNSRIDVRIPARVHFASNGDLLHVTVAGDAIEEEKTDNGQQ